MASGQEDWQSAKNTVLERSCHMFNNPFMSDVVFTCEGSDKKFFAHKYVLATSSAVFYAMFYGALAEKNPVVQLSDANEESLLEFLKFLYTDMCTVTTDNAFNMFYLANKYIVPSLAQKCYKFIEDSISSVNVFTILQQAIQISNENLKEKCWNLIDSETTEAVTSDIFIDINHALLVQLLKRETLKIREIDLFLAVLRWSEAECLRKGMEANAKNKRAILGNEFYEIRFGSMTFPDFSQNISGTGLLTTEEVLFFSEAISGKNRVSEIWNMSDRGVGPTTGESLLRCSRFGTVDPCSTQEYRQNDPKSNCFTRSHTLGVIFSQAVRIHGVHLLGRSFHNYDVTLEVLSQQVRKKCYAKSGSCSGGSGFDVMLRAPVKVQADVPVHIKAIITGQWSLPVDGVRGRGKVNVNDITVTFFAVPTRNNSTDVKKGQFYEIIFSKC